MHALTQFNDCAGLRHLDSLVKGKDVAETLNINNDFLLELPLLEGTASLSVTLGGD
jgi:hypothetical protein